MSRVWRPTPQGRCSWKEKDEEESWTPDNQEALMRVSSLEEAPTTSCLPEANIWGGLVDTQVTSSFESQLRDELAEELLGCGAAEGGVLAGGDDAGGQEPVLPLMEEPKEAKKEDDEDKMDVEDEIEPHNLGPSVEESRWGRMVEHWLSVEPVADLATAAFAAAGMRRRRRVRGKQLVPKAEHELRTKATKQRTETFITNLESELEKLKKVHYSA